MVDLMRLDPGFEPEAVWPIFTNILSKSVPVQSLPRAREETRTGILADWKVLPESRGWEAATCRATLAPGPQKCCVLSPHSQPPRLVSVLLVGAYIWFLTSRSFWSCDRISPFRRCTTSFGAVKISLIDGRETRQVLWYSWKWGVRQLDLWWQRQLKQGHAAKKQGKPNHSFIIHSFISSIHHSVLIEFLLWAMHWSSTRYTQGISQKIKKIKIKKRTAGIVLMGLIFQCEKTINK